MKTSLLNGIILAEDYDRLIDWYIQIMVSDIQELFERVKNSGKVLFGPTKEKDGDYVYGGIADPEGNQIWVVERKRDE